MKRREFIQTSCKYALLCASPLALGTLQSCEDADADYANNNDPIIPPDGGSDSGTDDGGSDSQGGSGTYVQIDISSSDLQSLQNVGGSAITQSNAADPNGFLLYRASDIKLLIPQVKEAGGIINEIDLNKRDNIEIISSTPNINQKLLATI